jgi:hypothetical protein
MYPKKIQYFMYSLLPPEPIHIQILQDLLFIQLDDFTQETVYFVKNKDEKTVRQGRFTGNSTQLSLCHLPSGHYSLGLHHLDEQIIYHFEKENGDYIFSGMYSNNTAKKVAV